MTLIRCPQCGYRRFDVIAESCERRQCGYTAYEVCPVDGCHRRARDYTTPHNHAQACYGFDNGCDCPRHAQGLWP